MRAHDWRTGPTLSETLRVYSYVCGQCGFAIKYKMNDSRMPPSAEALRQMAGPGVVPADCDEAAKIAAVRRVHES